MQILDKTRQETLTLHRKLSLGLFCNQLQHMTVITPPGDIVGTIRETFRLINTEYIIDNAAGQPLYRISGSPRYKWNLCLPPERQFKIQGIEDGAEECTITRLWSVDTSQYVFVIAFRQPDLDVKIKALFLAASFLIVSICRLFNFNLSIRLSCCLLANSLHAFY